MMASSTDPAPRKYSPRGGQAQDTIRIIRAYVVKRLVAETTDRGASAALVTATGLHSSHVAQVRQGKLSPGEDFCRTMAAHWGLTYQQLEDVARADSAMARHEAEPTS